MSTEDPKTYVGSLIAVLVAFLLFLFVITKKPTHQVVNCHLAEISPDFTLELRQQCRLLRATKL